MRRWVLVALAVCVLVGGCFSSSTGTVSGNVTFNGKPLEKGEIIFSPTSAQGGSAGGEVLAGKYQVGGLAPAAYQVSVTAVGELRIIGPNDPAAKRKLSDAEVQALIDPLPADTTGKEQAIEVKGGKNVLDFKLESKSRP